MSNTRAKKWVACVTTAAFFTTNVAWAGAPALPIPSLFGSSSPTFVFHAPRLDRPPEVETVRPAAQRNREERPSSEQRRESEARRPVTRLGEIPTQRVRDSLRASLGDRYIQEISGRDVARLPGLSSTDVAQLRAAFPDGAKIRLYADAAGNTIVAIASKDKIAQITIGADGPADVQIKDAPTTDRGPSGAPSQTTQRPASVASPRQVEAAERRLHGQVVQVGGQQVRLAYDDHAGHLVAFDMRGNRITEDTKIFTGTMRDASGQQVSVRYGIHHFELADNGALIVKGSAGLEAGRVFKDGNVNEQGSGGGRASASAVSHNLDVSVRPDGNVFYRAKVDGGSVAFTAAVQNGAADLENGTFQPVTAGSHNVTVATEGGVIAQAGPQRAWNAGNGNVFRFSDWQVAPDAVNNAGASKILQHFNISSGSSAMIDRDGHNVGRVSLDAGREVTQIVGASNDRGRAAVSAIYLSRRADFAEGGRHAGIEVGFSGPQGRSTVFLSPTASTPDALRQVARVAADMDNKTFVGGTKQDIEQAFASLASDPNVSRYEATAKLELNGKSFDIRVSGGGPTAAGAPLAPLIVSDSPELDAFLGVTRTSEGAPSRPADPKAAEALDGKVVNFGGQRIRLSYDAKAQHLVAYDMQGNRLGADDKIFSSAMTDTSGRTVNTRFSVHHFEVDGNRQLIARGAAQVTGGHVFKDGKVGEAGSGGKAGAGPVSHNLQVSVDGNNDVYFSGTGDVSFSAGVAADGSVDLKAATFQPITAGSHDISLIVNGEQIASAGEQGQWNAGNGNTFVHSDWLLTKPLDQMSAPAKAALSHFNISQDSAALVDRRGFTVGNVSLDGNREVRRITASGTDAGVEALGAIFLPNKADFAAGGKHAGVEVAVAGPQGRATVILSQNVSDVAGINTAMGAAAKLEGLSFNKASRADIDRTLNAAVQGNNAVARFETIIKVEDGGETHDVRAVGAGASADGQPSTAILLSNNAQVNEKLSLKNAESVRIPMNIGGRDVIVTADAAGRLVPTDAQGKRIEGAVFTMATKDTAGKPVEIKYSIDGFELAQNGQLLARATAELAAGTELFDGTVGPKPDGGAAAGGEAGTNRSRRLDVTVGADNRIKFKAAGDGARVSFTAAVTADGIDAANVVYQPIGFGATEITLRRGDGTQLAKIGRGVEQTGAGDEKFQVATWNVSATPADATVLEHFGIQNGGGVILNAGGDAVARVSTAADGRQAWTFQHTAAGDAAIKSLFFDNKPAFGDKGKLAGTTVAWSGRQATVTLNASATINGARATLEVMDGYRLSAKPSQSEIDAFFMAASKDGGVAAYEVTLEAPGGAVRVFGAGKAADGTVRRPEIGTDNKDLAYLSERKVTDVADLGVPIKGAKIESGAVTYRTDARGRRTITGASSVIRFSNGGGMIGRIDLDKDGSPETMKLYAAGQSGASAVLAGNGTIGERKITLLHGKSAVFDLKTGAVRNDGKTTLGGMKVTFLDDNNATLTYRQATVKSPAAVDFRGTIKTFVGPVSDARFSARVNRDGGVAFVLRKGQGPLKTASVIELPELAGSKGSSRLNGAEIFQVNLNVVSGASSAMGRSQIVAGQRVAIADGVGDPNGGRAAAMPEGADTKDVLVYRVAGGHEVAARPGAKGGSYVGVTLEAPTTPGGPIRGRAMLSTPLASGVLAGSDGVVIDGRTLSRGMEMTKTSPTDVRFTARVDGARVSIGPDDSRVTTTIKKAGASVHFGKDGMILTDSKARPNVTRDLESVSIAMPGITFSFKKEGKTLRVFRQKGEGQLTVFGGKVDAMDLKSDSGRIVNGRIFFDFKDGLALRMRREVDLKNGSQRVRDVAIKEIGFDPMTGGKVGVGRVRVEDGERLGFTDPAAPKGRRAGKQDKSERNSARTATVNVDIETRGNKTLVTGRGDASYLHATFSDDPAKKGRLKADVVVLSDHARNLRVVGGGATIQGYKVGAGLTVDIGVAARGQFWVKGSALAAGQSARIGMGSRASVTLNQGSVLGFSNGRPQFSSSKGSVVYRFLVPPMSGKGRLSVVGGLKNAVFTYRDGKIAKRYIPTYSYANRTGRSIRWQGMSVAAGTVFTPGRRGLKVHSGSLTRTVATKIPGVFARVTMTRGGTSSMLVDKNGRKWTPPPPPPRVMTTRIAGPARFKDGRATVPVAGGKHVGTVSGGGRVFTPDAPVRLHDRVRATQFNWNPRGEFVMSRGFAIDDKRVHHGFSVTKNVLRFVRPGSYSFPLMGNYVRVARQGSVQRVTTELKAPVGSSALVFSNREFYTGRVVRAPVGTATIRSAAGAETRVRIPEGTLAVQRDTDGRPIILTSDHYARIGSGGALTLSPTHGGQPVRFILEAESQLQAGKNGAVSIPVGSARIDRNMAPFRVGTLGNVPLFQGNAGGENPAGPLERIHYQRGANGEIDITRGRFLIQDNQAKLAARDVLISDNKEDKSGLDFMRMVVEDPNKPGRGTTKVAMRSYGGTNAEMADDVANRLKNTMIDGKDLGRYADVPKPGEQTGTLPIALIDRNFEHAGDISATVHREVRYFSAGTGAAPSRVETGNFYINGGRVNFNWRQVGEKRVEQFTYVDLDGKEKTTPTVYSVSRRDAYDMNPGGVRHRAETMERRDGVRGVWTWQKGAKGAELVEGNLLYVSSRFTEGGRPKVETSGTFERVVNGRVTQSYDLLGIYDLVAASPDVSDGRKKDAAGFRTQQDRRILDMIRTGRHSDGRADRHLNTIMGDPVSTLSSFGHRNDVVFGVSDFAIAATWGAGDYYLNGGRGWNSVANAMPAFAEAERQNDKLYSTVADVRSGDTSVGALRELPKTEMSAARAVDRWTSQNVFGFDQWMKAEKPIEVAGVIAWQTANAYTLGAGAAVRGTALTVQGGLTAVRTAGLASTGARLLTAGRALRTAQPWLAAGNSLRAAPATLTAGTRAFAGNTVRTTFSTTGAARGMQLWMRAGAANSVSSAYTEVSENGWTPEGQQKVKSALINVGLSEFGPLAYGLTHIRAGINAIPAGQRALAAVEGTKAAKWIGATADGIRSGRNVAGQYAVTSTLGAGLSLAYDASQGNIRTDSAENFVSDVFFSGAKGATAGTFGLAALRGLRALGGISRVESATSALSAYGKGGGARGLVAEGLVGLATHGRNLSVGAAGAVGYRMMGNVLDGRPIGEGLGDAAAQGSVMGLFGARVIKAIANAPRVLAGQASAGGWDRYMLDRMGGGVSLAVTVGAMRVAEMTLGQVPVLKDIIGSISEAGVRLGLLAPSREVMPWENPVAVIAEEMWGSFLFGTQFHPAFGLGTTGRSASSWMGLDRLFTRNPTAQRVAGYFIGGIDMQAFGATERLLAILSDRTGMVRLDRDDKGNYRLGEDGFFVVANPDDEGEMQLLRLAGNASAPSTFESVRVRRARDEMSLAAPSWRDAPVVRNIGAESRGEQRANGRQMINEVLRLSDAAPGEPITLRFGDGRVETFSTAEFGAVVGAARAIRTQQVMALPAAERRAILEGVAVLQGEGAEFAGRTFSDLRGDLIARAGADERLVPLADTFSAAVDRGGLGTLDVGYGFVREAMVLGATEGALGAEGKRTELGILRDNAAEASGGLLRSLASVVSPLRLAGESGVPASRLLPLRFARVEAASARANAARLAWDRAQGVDIGSDQLLYASFNADAAERYADSLAGDPAASRSDLRFRARVDAANNVFGPNREILRLQGAEFRAPALQILSGEKKIGDIIKVGSREVRLTEALSQAIVTRAEQAAMRSLIANGVIIADPSIRGFRFKEDAFKALPEAERALFTPAMVAKGEKLAAKLTAGIETMREFALMNTPETRREGFEKKFDEYFPEQIAFILGALTNPDQVSAVPTGGGKTFTLLPYTAALSMLMSREIGGERNRGRFDRVIRMFPTGSKMSEAVAPLKSEGTSFRHFEAKETSDGRWESKPVASEGTRKNVFEALDLVYLEVSDLKNVTVDQLRSADIIDLAMDGTTFADLASARPDSEARQKYEILTSNAHVIQDEFHLAFGSDGAIEGVGNNVLEEDIRTAVQDVNEAFFSPEVQQVVSGYADNGLLRQTPDGEPGGPRFRTEVLEAIAAQLKIPLEQLKSGAAAEPRVERAAKAINALAEGLGSSRFGNSYDLLSEYKGYLSTLGDKPQAGEKSFTQYLETQFGLNDGNARFVALYQKRMGREGAAVTETDRMGGFCEKYGIVEMFAGERVSEVLERIIADPLKPAKDSVIKATMHMSDGYQAATLRLLGTREAARQEVEAGLANGTITTDASRAAFENLASAWTGRIVWDAIQISPESLMTTYMKFLRDVKLQGGEITGLTGTTATIRMLSQLGFDVKSEGVEGAELKYVLAGNVALGRDLAGEYKNPVAEKDLRKAGFLIPGMTFENAFIAKYLADTRADLIRFGGRDLTATINADFESRGEAPLSKEEQTEISAFLAGRSEKLIGRLTGNQAITVFAGHIAALSAPKRGERASARDLNNAIDFFSSSDSVLRHFSETILGVSSGASLESIVSHAGENHWDRSEPSMMIVLLSEALSPGDLVTAGRGLAASRERDLIVAGSAEGEWVRYAFDGGRLAENGESISFEEARGWDPLESTCRHASLSIL